MTRRVLERFVSDAAAPTRDTIEREKQQQMQALKSIRRRLEPKHGAAEHPAFDLFRVEVDA